ncbi:MAG: flavin reductase family protein [Thermoanaerobaculaceae bacterium]
MLQDGAAPGACYFYYPRLVCVVGARDDGVPTTNLAPITWATPLSTDPPLFGICLSPQTHSHALVLRTGEFSVSYLPFAFASQVAAMGRVSGRSVDKARQFGIRLAEPTALATPWLADAYAAVECLLVDRHHFGDQTLLVGEVQAVHMATGAFDEDGVLRPEQVRALVYLGNRRYATLDVASVGQPEDGQ